jgi:hypothetical protein
MISHVVVREHGDRESMTGREENTHHQLSASSIAFFTALSESVIGVHLAFIVTNSMQPSIVTRTLNILCQLLDRYPDACSPSLLDAFVGALATPDPDTLLQALRCVECFTFHDGGISLLLASEPLLPILRRLHAKCEVPFSSLSEHHKEALVNIIEIIEANQR